MFVRKYRKCDPLHGVCFRAVFHHHYDNYYAHAQIIPYKKTLYVVTFYSYAVLVSEFLIYIIRYTNIPKT